MAGERAADRVVLAVSGEDRVDFLQGLVSNDVNRAKAGLCYAALLTPQGKYLADFLMVERDGAILIDVKDTLAEVLARRLSMYRLRAKVTIARTDLKVSRGIGPAPDDAMTDPRDARLGWRVYGPDEGAEPQIDWDAIRVAACVPETGVELIPDETFPLEVGFERLNGVDFRKGCYVGQEVTARMKHKTDLRKGLALVEVAGVVPVGTEILTGDGKVAGAVFTQSGGTGIAYLRFDRADGAMIAAGVTVRRAG
jgi:tRNA-modifying protein YgfZ